MNIEKLKKAEKDFYDKHPGGFNHPEMQAIGKKHKMEKMISMANELFAEDRFDNPNQLCLDYAKIVSTSTMLSLFEKPKFKEFINTASDNEKKEIAFNLKEFLYGIDGAQESGFDHLSDIFAGVKQAKWTIMTIIPAYLRPKDEVFVKPTTAKGIIEYFEIDYLKYKPKPSYAFYNGFRDVIHELKLHVDEDLKPSNAAFTGFLMMSCL